MAWKVKSCCCCFPLRKGLLVFGYIKIILNYIFLLRLMFQINDIFNMNQRFDPINSIALSLGFAMTLIDFIFSVVFLSALHKRSGGLLEHYYNYMVVLLIIQISGAALFIPLKIYQVHYIQSGIDVILLLLGMLIVAGLIIVFQIYFVILLNSVLPEMKDKTDQEFDILVEPGPSIELTQQKRQRSEKS